MQHVYHYPSIGKIDDLVVTDSRETAKQCIQKGYTLFTVPQMFGLEEGLFTLFLEDHSQMANKRSKEAADHVLSDFEKSIRDQYSAGLKY